MVLHVEGAPLEEAPACSASLYHQFPALRGPARALTAALPSARPGAAYSAAGHYLTAREYAAAQGPDSRLEVLATDRLGCNLALVLRNPATGTTLLAQVDRLTASDLDAMTAAVAPLGYSSPLSLSLVGSYQDRAGVSLSLLGPILSTLHHHPHRLDLVLLCLGELATTRPEGSPTLPTLPGVAVSLRTGEVFPLADCSMDRGPDLDLRVARTLAASGEKVPGMLALYDCQREQLLVGPFTYEPMRAVDIWLGQPDEFLLQSLCPVPEAVDAGYARQLRAALQLVKEHPYPSVSLFQSDCPRVYSKLQTGGWSPHQPAKLPWYPQQHHVKAEAFPSLTVPALASCHFKTEPMPWHSFPLQTQAHAFY
jgi:hypothetical protein